MNQVFPAFEFWAAPIIKNSGWDRLLAGSYCGGDYQSLMQLSLSVTDSREVIR